MTMEVLNLATLRPRLTITSHFISLVLTTLQQFTDFYVYVQLDKKVEQMRLNHWHPMVLAISLSALPDESKFCLYNLSMARANLLS